MTRSIVFLLLTVVFLGTALAFAPPSRRRAGSALVMEIASVPPPIEHFTQASPRIESEVTFVSPLMRKTNNFDVSSPQLLSLEERRPPTKEEIEAKKRNFNFWFWGGGFVAPFLATFYYFGYAFYRFSNLFVRPGTHTVLLNYLQI